MWLKLGSKIMKKEKVLEGNCQKKEGIPNQLRKRYFDLVYYQKAKKHLNKE